MERVGERQKEERPLACPVTVQVSDNLALTEALSSEEGQAKRSLGHKAHSS